MGIFPSETKQDSCSSITNTDINLSSNPMENRREQAPFRGRGGGGGYNPRHYPRETPRDVAQSDETSTNRHRRGSVEELVFDEDSGQLVAKKQTLRPLGGQTVLTGIATSGFF